MGFNEEQLVNDLHWAYTLLKSYTLFRFCILENCEVFEQTFIDPKDTIWKLVKRVSVLLKKEGDYPEVCSDAIGSMLSGTMAKTNRSLPCIIFWCWRLDWFHVK